MSSTLAPDWLDLGLGESQPEPDPPARSRIARLLRGRPGDPAWARPALLALLVATAVLYLWGLGSSGWANSFYSAAVQAGTKSWKALFFGSSDSSNFITVDKPPASLWIMEVSARIFGLSSWSILAPQALEGVAAVAVLYAALKRWFGAGAGLLAGAVLATTPVAAVMFRYNNPDALLILLLTIAAYVITRALEDGRTRWLVLAGALVGLGFITKMLQAFLVVPGLAGAYLLAGPPRLARRLGQLLIGGVAMLVSAGWWVVTVELIPAADRPYIGGSQDNSLWNLIFGYNGFGRLTGNESGSVVAGGAGSAGQWGPTGLTRLFNASFGGQASWMLPAALLLLVAGLVVTGRRSRVDRTRAALVLWGGWLVVTGLVFSLSKGIIHPYYTVALAPALGAVAAIGASALWTRRRLLPARMALAATLAATAWWSWTLLDRSPTWLPWLRVVVLLAGALGTLALLLPLAGWRRLSATVAVASVAVGLAGSTAYAVDTAATAHRGAIPSAGPAIAGGGFGGGPGAAGRVGRLGIPRGAIATHGNPPSGAAGGFGGGGFGGLPGGPFAGPGPSSNTPGAVPPGSGASGPTFAPRPGAGAAGGAGGSGGILGSSTPAAALTRALQTNASAYRWVAAVVSSEQASGYQLASGDPVMAIGGFNGTDPAPSLAQFEACVKAGDIHYFIVSGGGGPGSGGGPAATGPANGPRTSGQAAAAGTQVSSQITSWVESHFSAETIGGTTVYDLSSGAAGPAAEGGSATR
jgi:4-amino-4-deoxy-L-arabinose transferase-like glycosyltransferase